MVDTTLMVIGGESAALRTLTLARPPNRSLSKPCVTLFPAIADWHFPKVASLQEPDTDKPFDTVPVPR